MKLQIATLAFALSLPLALSAQDSTVSHSDKYPNTFSSGSADIHPFNNDTRRFNDWSVSIGGGVPLVQSADLTSIKNGNGKNVFGYSSYLSLDKAITHAFGLKLQYDRGETRQGFYNTKDHSGRGYAARTQYDAISILGDVNFSNLLRRVDNKSPYRWALHGYAGVGTLAYRAYLAHNGGAQKLMTEIKPFTFRSMFGQAGTGLKYKISNRLDLEGRLMYVVTGDDEFDGGGDQYSVVNEREEQNSDDFFNATLGLTFKLGKHETNVMWYDPLQNIYSKLDILADNTVDVKVCKNGDKDDDGVCDDWDRQLDTPTGARVDGAGVALDTDLDGVIDLYDQCVTVPGPVENHGCPVQSEAPASPVKETVMNLEGIEFDFDSSKILTSNKTILDNAVNYINSSTSNFNVIGATDDAGSVPYNQKLSERRANSVVNYLVKNGVKADRLHAIGKGKNDLKYPECRPVSKCPAWKNRANRRVYFEAK
ncbi:OmpA family protein [Riemerella columbipharyngis]|uniref:OmpA-OmpF porin, OOP family n=1 Tax=Riemerella columbipharyngis TaxID=1071918 RepID=A0A1G7EFC9_9FLAO|nr:OmpA family protein [Riemerella columbipharyngis]SDE62352.1 OmpA-OmpF porin, OOP family [Riemerella columbipharyngis]